MRSPLLNPVLRPKPRLALTPMRAITHKVALICFFVRRLRTRLLHDQTSSSVGEIPTDFPVSNTLRSPLLNPVLSPVNSPVLRPVNSPMRHPNIPASMRPPLRPTLSPRSSPTRIPFLMPVLFTRYCHFGLRDGCFLRDPDAVVLIFSKAAWRRMLPSPTPNPIPTPLLNLMLIRLLDPTLNSTPRPTASPISTLVLNHVKRRYRKCMRALPLLSGGCRIVLSALNIHPISPPRKMFRIRNAKEATRGQSNKLTMRLTSTPMRISGNRTAQRSYARIMDSPESQSGCIRSR